MVKLELFGPSAPAPPAAFPNRERAALWAVQHSDGVDRVVITDLTTGVVLTDAVKVMRGKHYAFQPTVINGRPKE